MEKDTNDSGMDRELKAVRQVFTHGYREDKETQKDRRLQVVPRVKLEGKSTVQDIIRSTQRKTRVFLFRRMVGREGYSEISSFYQ